MKRAGSLVATLLLANPLVATVALGSEAPLYCKYKPSRGLRAEQEELCRKFELTDNKEEKIAKENAAEPLPEASYPLFSEGAILEEGLPPLFVVIEAKDSGTIKMSGFVKANQKRESFESDPALPMTLVGKNIEFWGGADMSGHEYNLGAAAVNTASWITGAVIGSIGTAGLALPFMLLAAPFVGASSGNQYIPDHRLVVRYLDENDGNVKLFTLQIFDKTKFLELSSVFKDMTGLDAGQKAENIDYSVLRKDLLVRKEAELDEIKVSLMVVDRKKPWCSSLDLSGRKGSTDAYTSKLKEINELRGMLEFSEYEEIASKGSEEKWNLYLKNNPNLSAWAEANPLLTQKKKSC
jgi:hypothetical protein